MSAASSANIDIPSPCLVCRYSYSKTRFICAPSFEHSNQGFNMLFLVVGIIAPTLIMCSLYGYIVYIARKQVRRGTFVCNDQHCFYVPANTYFKSSIVMVATSGESWLLHNGLLTF